MKRALIAVVLLAAAGLVAWAASALFSVAPSSDATGKAPLGAAMVDVVVPQILSYEAVEGKALFDANCASCHGRNAAGQEAVAPPLVHIIYEPSHHGDDSFQLAVSQGVRAHHWPFGDMARVEGLTRADVTQIVAYVRSLQRANGID